MHTHWIFSGLNSTLHFRVPFNIFAAFLVWYFRALRNLNTDESEHRAGNLSAIGPMIFLTSPIWINKGNQTFCHNKIPPQTAMLSLPTNNLLFACTLKFKYKLGRESIIHLSLFDHYWLLVGWGILRDVKLIA